MKYINNRAQVQKSDNCISLNLKYKNKKILIWIEIDILFTFTIANDVQQIMQYILTVINLHLQFGFDENKMNTFISLYTRILLFFLVLSVVFVFVLCLASNVVCVS
jgi:hypothetical protein